MNIGLVKMTLLKFFLLLFLSIDFFAFFCYDAPFQIRALLHVKWMLLSIFALRMRAEVFMTQSSILEGITEALSSEFERVLAGITSKGDDTFLGALNALLVKVYSILPDAGQFALRTAILALMAKYQRRIPPALYVPLVAFLDAYLSTLERDVGGSGTARPSADDVRAAAEKVARMARNGASELGKLLVAAKTAAASNPPPAAPEGDMSKKPQTAPPATSTTPPASQAAKKSGLAAAMDGFTAIATALPDLSEGWRTARRWLADAGEEADEAATWMAYLLMALAVALVATEIAILGSAVGAPSASGHVAWLITALWLVLPLGAGVAGAIFAPDGSTKLGSAVTSIVLVGGLSSLVIATAHGVALFAAPFAWSHLAANLAAIVVADFTWRLGDLGSDALKAVFRIIPDVFEPEWMKRGSIGFRKALFTLAVADSAVAFLVALWATWNHTLYGVGSLGLAVACLLMAAYGYSRTSLTPNKSPSDLLGQVGEHRQKNLSRFFWAGTLGILLGVLPLGANALLPPECPTDPELAPRECPVELPTYAERWHATVADPCSVQVEQFVSGLERNDCKVILEAGTDASLIALCEEARDCGALAPDGRKVVRVREEKEQVVNDWGVGEMVLAGLALVGVIFLCILILAALGGGEEKKEGSKGH